MAFKRAPQKKFSIKKPDRAKKPSSESNKEDSIIVTGRVIKKETDARFQVQLLDKNPNINDKVIVAKSSGKIVRNSISIVNGDWVEIKISPYDTTLSQGMIYLRLKEKPEL